MDQKRPDLPLFWHTPQEFLAALRRQEQQAKVAALRRAHIAEAKDRYIGREQTDALQREQKEKSLQSALDRWSHRFATGIANASRLMFQREEQHRVKLIAEVDAERRHLMHGFTSRIEQAHEAARRAECGLKDAVNHESGFRQLCLMRELEARHHLVELHQRFLQRMAFKSKGSGEKGLSFVNAANERRRFAREAKSESTAFRDFVFRTRQPTPEWLSEFCAPLPQLAAIDNLGCSASSSSRVVDCFARSRLTTAEQSMRSDVLSPLRLELSAIRGRHIRPASPTKVKPQRARRTFESSCSVSIGAADAPPSTEVLVDARLVSVPNSAAVALTAGEEDWVLVDSDFLEDGAVGLLACSASGTAQRNLATGERRGRSSLGERPVSRARKLAPLC